MERRNGAQQMERVTLDLLSRAEGPVGSRRLVETFREHGIHVAEATAGRFLRQLDWEGLTRPVSKQGRVLTEHGFVRLKQLRLLERLDYHSAELVRAINAIDVDELIDLLYVRRAVEAEAARLAAVRATAEECEQIRTAVDSQMRRVMASTDGTEYGLSFHLLVARASHNSTLRALIGVLVDPASDPVDRLINVLSVQSGAQSAFTQEHRDVAEAICAHEADAAQNAMRHHIDAVIRLFERYRSQVPDREADAVGQSP